MTNKVILSIKGVQHEFGEDGTTEMITTGNYYYKNGRHYILYDENIPETGEQVSNTLKMAPGCIDMIKHGRYGTHMVFEPNKKNMALYPTPYGMMEVCFNTFGLNMNEEEEMINVQIEYALEINDEFISDCTIQICIRSKEH